jgi:hypothetical protein
VGVNGSYFVCTQVFVCQNCVRAAAAGGTANVVRKTCRFGERRGKIRKNARLEFRMWTQQFIYFLVNLPSDTFSI